MKAKAGAATVSRGMTPASRLDAWLSAMRPRTLPMALSPVFVGACFAEGFAGGINAPAVVVAALSAVCIQIATNLYNDAADFERGGDGPDRLGPKRAAASGLLAPDEIKRAAFAFFALAAFGGLHLVTVGGWPNSGAWRPVDSVRLGLCRRTGADLLFAVRRSLRGRFFRPWRGRRNVLAVCGRASSGAPAGGARARPVRGRRPHDQ